MNNKLFYLLAMGVLLLSACQKDTYINPHPSLASVTVVNAAIGLGPVYVNPYASGVIYAKQTDSLTYQGAKEYGLPSGSVPLKLVSYRDTLKQVFNGSLSFAPSKIYSLYLAGSGPNYDTLLRAEANIPLYADSAIAVRVINLSANSPAVTINLPVTPSAMEFTVLSYKQQTEFKKYPLTAADAKKGLSFEVRDASSHEVVTSFRLQSNAYYPYNSPSVKTSRFKAITLVISGTYGADPYGSEAYSVFALPNY